MKACVYKKDGSCHLEDRPLPKVIDSHDCVVRIEKTTICGTDLHILRGNVPTCKPGRILGHEGVGVVEEIGGSVAEFKPGDEVLISCITSCGRCSMCRDSMFGQCLNGGWILGNEIDGCQAEFVRIPYADTSLTRLPKDIDKEALVLLSDIFPTGYEVGVIDGEVKPGCSIAIVGCGPVGLAALMTAQFFSPSQIFAIDTNYHRLEVSKALGATDIVTNDRGQAVNDILSATDNRGVDVVIEAIGTPTGWEICQDIVKPGGNIAVLGVHGKPALLNLERMWKRNFKMTAGLVHTYSIPLLIRQIRSGRLDPHRLISHRFSLGELESAYHTFNNAAESHALKVIINAF